MRNNITCKKLLKIAKKYGSSRLNLYMGNYEDDKSRRLSRRAIKVYEALDKIFHELDFDDFCIEYFHTYEQTIRKRWCDEDEDFVYRMFHLYTDNVISTEKLISIISDYGY